MPFTDTTEASPPHLHLEPVGSHEFLIVQGFRYRAPEEGARSTRLAGVTRRISRQCPFLQWFVRSYGRHTLAAVLHDYLWRLQRGIRPLDNVAFKQPNRVFRVAMDEL